MLQLESANCPVPVKKQRKYNLARWAVTGRDNTAVNAACERIYRGMLDSSTPDWKELCYLWASDFRTHLTEKRWAAFSARLETAEATYAPPGPAPVMVPQLEPAADRHLNIETRMISARLDRRRGLALERLRIDVDRTTAPLMGLLTHRPSRRANGSAGLFCQLQLSALELDDTRKPGSYRDGPRRFRFSISAL